MTRDKFVEKYYDIVKHALAFSEKARREGLLALDNELDLEKVNNRDIFEYGIRFVVDGTGREIVEKILTNLVKQEKDENIHILKTMQKEAVLAIEEGINPGILHALLNSFTDIPLSEDQIENQMEELIQD
jgi:flagellar motor component MotA